MKISLETKEFRLRKNILSKRRKNVKGQTRLRIVAALPGEIFFINIHIILQYAGCWAETYTDLDSIKAFE